MTTSGRAKGLILAILVAGGAVLFGLHHFAETGQFAPASATGGATRSDQRDATVADDVAIHKR